MANIKKTSLPAIIITLVFIGVGAFAVVSFLNKSGTDEQTNEGQKENDKKEKENQGVINIAASELANSSYPEVAADMLQKIILDKDVTKHREILKSASPDELEQQLNNDELRLCFWINVYNAYTQYFLKTDPSLYKSDRNEFFKKEQIPIAGFNLRMHDIEHGALRRGATIWSKGHIRIPFRNEFVNRYKVSEVDYRIHFALNCGAKSCPPVCVYLPDRTNSQLDKATCYYLSKECEYKKEENKIMLPALMTWFADDFGIKEDKLNIVKGCKVIPEGASPDVEYKNYDWTMKIRNYKQF